jgi:NAD(P)-dependent dehydrogenase (short-subunit alcohol dehydrogenase family)
MTLLAGRVAVVSGVGPGLGRDVALQLAAHGADVVLGARGEAHIAAVAAEVEAMGRRAVPVQVDVTDPDACHAAVAACLDTFGRVDVLVNNAFHDGDFARFEDADLDSWRRTMEVNLWGTLHMSRAVVPAMREQGDGRIVMINSMSVRRIRPRFGAYAASKAALESATKTLAAELGPYGIRVNGIHPGYIWGPSVQAYFAHQAARRGVDPEDVYREVAGETCLGYLPTPAEIAGSVVFFASDLSKPVTGQSLGVNAGHWLS